MAVKIKKNHETEIDDELGPILDAEGAPVEADAPDQTEKVLPFKDNGTGRQYKAKIDKIRVLKWMERNYGLALMKITKAAGFSEKEAENLKSIDEADPRIEKLLELQNKSNSLRRAEAEIAVAAFEKWNAPYPAPTVEDLTTKGGVYGGYLEAVTADFLGGGNGSEAATETS